MFCSACGKEATGKFCWNCGAALHSATKETQAAPAADWQHEINYDTLIHNPEVRDLLAKERPATVHMTGEDFVDSFGKILDTKISLVPVMAIAQDVYSRLGVHTGKTRSEQYRSPVGQVIVSVLCALARGGYKVHDVHQASDGCMLICDIPSDMFSLAGQLLVTIQREPAGASVHADTRIEGQLFDWGKSDRCLKELFGGIVLS